jgi:hypothetical protein
MRRLVVVLAVAATVVGAACTQVATDPSRIVALTFDSLPFPAVVAFDSLRDEDGVARPLAARALNASGNPIEDAPITYLATLPGVTISPEGFVIAGAIPAAPVPIVAQSGILQTRSLLLPVVPRPSRFALTGTVDTLRYVLPDNSQNTSSPISARVTGAPSGETAAPPVLGWVVRYRVAYNGVLLPPDHPDIWLVDDAGRRSQTDTTGSDGSAARAVRVRATALATALDSVVVFISARAYGASLSDTSLRVVVPIIPR